MITLKQIYHDTKRIANLIANKLKLLRNRFFQNIKLIPETRRDLMVFPDSLINVNEDRQNVRS